MILRRHDPDRWYVAGAIVAVLAAVLAGVLLSRYCATWSLPNPARPLSTPGPVADVVPAGRTWAL